MYIFFLRSSYVIMLGSPRTKEISATNHRVIKVINSSPWPGRGRIMYVSSNSSVPPLPATAIPLFFPKKESPDTLLPLVHPAYPGNQLSGSAEALHIIILSSAAAAGSRARTHTTEIR
jgi:hypothetical protein